MMPIDIKIIAILNIHGVDYCCVINGIRTSEAIILLKNAGLSKKWIINNLFIFYKENIFYRLAILKFKNVNYTVVKI